MNELFREMNQERISLRGMEKPRRQFWWVEEQDSAFLLLQVW